MIYLHNFLLLDERNHSIATKMWCGAVKLISGYKPSLYSCQRSLPRLPVPAVRDTLNRLYESLKPLCTEDELKEIMQQGRVCIYFVLFFKHIYIQ